MKQFLYLMLASLTFASCKQATTVKYPETKKISVTDTIFGTPVEDQYRWLEDDHSEETRKWIVAQNEVTRAFLDRLPGREQIRERITALTDYARITTPVKEAGKYFFFKNDGLQNQSVLFMSDSLNGEPRVLLDPNALSEDGTVALSGTKISPDGKYLIYKTSCSGSDWNEIFVKDIETGRTLPDHIRWVKFSGISWYDGGFFYSCYPAPEPGNERKKSNENQQVRYHKIGTDPSCDPLILSDPEHSKRNLSVSVTDDYRFMILTKSESTSGNSLEFRDMSKKNRGFVPLMKDFEYDFNVIDNLENELIVITNYKAPRYRILKIDTRKPNESDWTELVAEKTEVLTSADIAGEKLVLTYMKDACSHLEVYNLEGKFEYEIKFPGIGSTSGISGKKEDSEAFYTFTSFNTPGEVYRYDFSSNESTVYFRPEVKFNPGDFQVDQVFYSSKDGTKIPMFLFYRKGMVRNGKNPVLLYGYGGFNNSLTPAFSVQRLFFAENGGIVAVANLRGGGEYGEEWHKAGTKLNKQNVFDDFIAAAEYLVEQKYTSPAKLAIQGGSNGGLLVGAVVNQRPELFKVALPAVGVMDMLRYHKFTIGWAWATDYGTSDDSPEMFRYLYGYSPYHNIVKDGKYPAILVTTADHDDRVVPAHSFKYISRLQECNRGKLPVLIRIETKAGHGAGKPTSKVIDEYTDIWAFTFYHLGIKLH